MTSPSIEPGAPATTAEGTTPAPVAVLGRYVIAGKIATGGMATVYLARLDAAGGFAREFALKVIHPHLADQPGFRDRFHRESRLASRVRHPNVVTTVDAGEDQGYCYMALELIEGGTLRQLELHRGRAFPAAEAAQIVVDVARGLHALHTAVDETGNPMHVVHRDLSPHNVMLDRTGRAVLIDLGLAKAEQSTALTQFGMLAGRLPYMSPEQARTEALDARSDVFSLGTVLFELATGTLPFGEAHSAETLDRLQRCDEHDVAQRLHAAHVPGWLSQIVLICLRPQPDRRFATAEALADALAQELAQAGYVVAEIKQRLAAGVEGALPEIGTLAPMESLPRRIDSTGMLARVEPVPLPRRGPPPVLYVLGGAAAALVVFTGVWLVQGGLGASERAPTPTQAAPASAPADDEPGRAASTPTPPAVPPSAPPPAPAAEPAPTGPTEAPPSPTDEVLPEEPPDEQAASEPTAPRTASPKRRAPAPKPGEPDAPKLKPNPYAELGG